MRLTLIAAMARNRVIGVGNRLPWNLAEDLKHFRELTAGHPVIMGRKTYESIGRLLPKRTNVIVSRQPGYRVEGAVCVGSLDEAVSLCRELDAAAGADEVFVIGGGEIYAQSLPLADRLELTLIDQDFEGDARFPEWPAERFREVAREERVSLEGLRFAFVRFERA